MVADAVAVGVAVTVAVEVAVALAVGVALAVAGKIEPTVLQAEIRRASARPTDNLSSYDLYLRALPHTATSMPDGGEIAFVAASPTAPNHTAHIKYMKEYIKDDPKYQVFKVVDTQYANDDDAKSYDVAVNLMQAHPDLKVIISSSAVSAPSGARAISASGQVGKVFSTGFALPSAIKSYIKDGSEKCFALWDPEELGYLATYATHLKLAGKLDVKPGVKFKAGKAGEYTVGDGGEIVYGKPLMFTKDNIDQFNF